MDSWSYRGQNHGNSTRQQGLNLGVWPWTYGLCPTGQVGKIGKVLLIDDLLEMACSKSVLVEFPVLPKRKTEKGESNVCVPRGSTWKGLVACGLEKKVCFKWHKVAAGDFAPRQKPDAQVVAWSQ